MPALIEAVGRRDALIGELRQIIDTADAESRGLTAEENQQSERIEADIAALDVEIRRREMVSRPLADGDDESRHLVAGDGRDPEPMSLNEYRRQHDERERPQDVSEYRMAFYRLVSARDPRSLTNDELRALSTATAGAGANLVPTAFSNQLIDQLRWFGSIRSLATVVTTAAGEDLEVPTVSSKGSASWTAENAAYTESDDAFGKVTLRAYKAGTIMKVSEELLPDSAFDLEGYIAREFAARIGVLEETAYAVGDGSGKPTGLVTSAGAGVTAAAVAAVTADEMIDLYYAVPAQYRSRGVYLVSDALEKAMRKLKDADNQYLWQSSLQAGVPATFNGRPVFAHPDMAAPAASAVPAVFGDMSYFWIRDVNGVAMQRLVELYAANGQVGFRAYHRTDSALTNTAAVKKLTMAAS